MAKTSPNADARAARKRAEVTPPIVLDAMLAGPIECCGITLHPLCLDIVWVLQSCKHPAFDPASNAATEMNPLQIAQLIYAFAAPDEAVVNAPQSDGGQSMFDSEAFRFCRKNVPMNQTREVIAHIAQLIKAGYSTAPTARNPRSAGPA